MQKRFFSFISFCSGTRFKTAFGIFSLAFLLRTLFFLTARPYYVDAWSLEEIGINGWLDIAQNFASGKGFSHSSLLTYFPMGGGLEPTAARSPVPVLFLSAVLFIFGNHFYYALFIQSWLLSAASAALLYRVAEKTLRSRKMALAVSLFYCFYLPEMYLSTTYAAGSESLFTFLLMTYFYLMIKQVETRNLKLAIAAGGVLGLAFLSKPVVLFFPVLYAGWAVWKYRKKAAASIAVFMAAFILCVSPWVVRNTIVMGKPVLTTTLGGYNLLRHNWLISRGEYRLCTAEDFLPMVNQTIEESHADMKALSEVQLNELFTGKAREIILRYPWRYLKFTAIRAVWLWYKIGAEKPLYLFWNLLIYIFMFPGMLIIISRKMGFILKPLFVILSEAKDQFLTGSRVNSASGIHFLKAGPSSSLRLSQYDRAEGILFVFAVHILYFVVMHIGINAQFRFISPMMPYGIMIAFYVLMHVIARVTAAQPRQS